jgi:hypothetical protein
VTVAKPPKDQKDLAQFNYRLPGEAETIGMESREDPNRDTKAVEKRINDEQKVREHQREDSRSSSEGGEGLSPMKGMSEPKTQKEVDDENTWSSAR